MKILSLHLQAFGPFTDVSLDLSEGDHGLHLFYGPNEAGKSSSLRAIKQLLYGIPPRSTDNFVHSNQELRIGGLLEHSDGERIDIIRRKGSKNTLIDARTNEAIDEQLLLRYLGGVDEDSFSHRFGIDHQQMTAGGHAMVSGDGDLGKALFSASTGVIDLGHIEKSLSTEAAELFKPSGKAPKVNKLLADFSKLRKEIKGLRLAPKDWKDLDQRLSESRAELAHIQDQLRSTQQKRRSLSRMRQAIPIVAKYGDAEKQLAQMEATPELRPDFSQQRIKIETELRDATRTIESCRSEIDRLKNQIGQLTIPDSILNHREQIEHLYPQWGGIRKAQSDQPRLLSEQRQLTKELDDFLARLGQELPIDQIAKLRITDAQQLRVSELANQRQSLVDAVAASEDEIRRLEQTMKSSQQELDELNFDSNWTLYESQIQKIVERGPVEDDLEESRSELSRLQNETEQLFAQLPGYAGNLATLSKAKVPSVETCHRYDELLTESKNVLAQVNEKIAQAAQRQRSTVQQIDAIRLEQDVPTEAELDDIRKLRTLGWSLIRRSAESGSELKLEEVQKYLSHFPSVTELNDAFELNVTQADDLVDRLRRESSRVESNARLLAEKAAIESEQALLEREQISAKEQFDQHQLDWQEQWKDASVTSSSPREMSAWLQRWDAIQVNHRNAQLLESRRANLTKIVEESREIIIAILKPNFDDQTQVNEKTSLSQLISLAQGVSARQSVTNSKWTQKQEEIQKSQVELNERQLTFTRAKEQLATWTSQWNETMASVNLSSEATPQEASSTIATTAKLFEKDNELSRLNHRLDGIAEDHQQFETEMGQLVDAIGHTNIDQSSSAPVIEFLHDQLVEGLQDNQKRRLCQQQLETTQAEHTEATARLNKQNDDLAQLCKEAECERTEDLPEIEKRYKARCQALTSHAELRDQIQLVCGNTSLDEFNEATAQLDVDQLETELGQLDSEITELEEQQTKLATQIGHHESELGRMNGNASAADAELEAQTTLSQIGHHSQQFVRLVIAKHVLRETMERYRQQSQGPVLKRASELFGSLTLNRFTGLQTDFDSKDNPVIKGVRSESNMLVDVHGMSEGTCDQLFLSLRLASMEDYLTQHEPLPLIVDDTLVMFDDLRCVAALEALSELAKSTQVIMFTHHEHLVRLAEAKITNEQLFVHQLPSAAPSTQPATQTDSAKQS